MEEFNNLFNSNLIGPYLAMILLIKYTSVPSTQRLSYRRNITKLRTIKAVTKKGDKDIYIGHSN
jgi:Holliday junction resolvasome RuvABC DNA-binding subunit